MSRRFTVEDLRQKGFAVEGNKAEKANKIRGAAKQEVDGQKFDSKLELYFFNLLKALKIPFKFQVTYELQGGFKFHGTTIRPIKMIVDFYLPDHDLIVDTKGFQLADNKIKFKLLKHWLLSNGLATRIELPRNKEECDKLINEINETNVRTNF